jgi:hypothetical protein
MSGPSEIMEEVEEGDSGQVEMARVNRRVVALGVAVAIGSGRKSEVCINYGAL